MRATYWQQQHLPDNVPTWCADGDGLVVIERHTARNGRLESRYNDGVTDGRIMLRSLDMLAGYVVFNEFNYLATFSTLREAQAYADGYWQGAYVESQALA